MRNKKIKIGFIGAGSIGSLFGAYLTKFQEKRSSGEESKISVVFFCRSAHANQINKKGLQLENEEGISIIRGIKAYTNSQDYLVDEELNRESIFFDYLFLTTKTYDIKSALNQYKTIVKQSKYLVILQNGIGNEEIINNIMPDISLIRLVTTNGGFLKEPGYIVHTGKGITKMGIPKRNESNLEASTALGDLKQLLEESGLKSRIVDDIIKVCWEKVFVNIGINAFGALTRLRNGDLLKIEGLKKLMKRAINEAKKVAQERGIDLGKKDFVELTYEVARKTADNLNSMLQDVRKGSPTEIDFINGRIVGYANRLGIEVPINETITYLIKGLEYTNQRKE
ncbi:MAG: 2-dehydropantoate 2-reductase [Promethearchaeia archaeon]